MTFRSMKYVCLASLLLSISIGLTSCGSPATNNSNTPKPSPSPSPSASPSPSPTPTCAAGDDTNIVKEITQKVDSSSVLGGIRRQFNWDSKGCEVHLVGWTGTAAIRDEVIKIVGNTPEVEKINIQHFHVNENLAVRPDENGACPDGWTACDQICVPPGQSCVNRPAMGTPSPSPAPTPSPSATK